MDRLTKKEWKTGRHPPTLAVDTEEETLKSIAEINNFLQRQKYIRIKHPKEN